MLPTAEPVPFDFILCFMHCFMGKGPLNKAILFNSGLFSQVNIRYQQLEQSSHVDERLSLLMEDVLHSDPDVCNEYVR